MKKQSKPFQNQRNHLVQNSCFLYNNPTKKLQKTGPQRVPTPCRPFNCNYKYMQKKKKLFWLALFFFLFLYSFNCGWMGVALSVWFVGRVGTWNLPLRSDPPFKKNGGRVYYCGPNITIYIILFRYIYTVSMVLFICRWFSFQWNASRRSKIEKHWVFLQPSQTPMPATQFATSWNPGTCLAKWSLNV